MKRTPLERAILAYRRQSNRTKAFFWVIVGAVIILITPAAIRQHQISVLRDARMYFSGPTGKVIPGQTFDIEVRLQTKGTPTNAVSAALRFNPAYLEVQAMTTEKSFCTFYLDNAFDNIKGEVNISCGVPNPGFLGDSVVAHLSLRAKLAGETKITLDPNESRVLANDGRGSDITQDLPSLSIAVQPLL